MERAGILPGDSGEAAVAGRSVVLGRHRPLAILVGRRPSPRGTHVIALTATAPRQPSIAMSAARGIRIP